MANRAVQILINARDMASAPLKHVQQTVRSVAATVRRVSFAAPVAALNGLRAAASAAIAPLIKISLMLAPFLALAGAIRTLGQSLGDFGRQEAALRNLGTTLELVGANAKQALPDLANYASELQAITTIGDEATLELMRNGLMLGIQTDQLKGATQAAIGLSEALGLDVNMAMRAVANANEGQFEILQRYLPALRTATNDTEKLAIVNEAAARGFELAKSQTQTYAGAMQQLWNAVGDTREVLGEALAPAIMKVAGFIRGILPTIEAWIRKAMDLRSVWQSAGNLIATTVNGVVKVFRAGFNLVATVLNQFGINAESTSNFFKDAMDLVSRVINATARTFVAGFAGMQAVVENWRQIIDVALLAVRLGIVKLNNTIANYISGGITSALERFARFWGAVFTGIANTAAKSLTNVAMNVAKLAASLPDLLAGKLDASTLLTGTEDLSKQISGSIVKAVVKARNLANPQLEAQLEGELASRSAGVATSIRDKINQALADFDASGGLINPGDLAASIFIGLTGDAKKTIDNGIKIDAARTGAEEARFLTLGPRIQQEPAIATAKNTEQQLKLSTKMLPAMVAALQRIEALTSSAPRVRIGGFST